MQWLEMYGWFLFAVVSMIMLIFCIIRESRRRSYKGASIKFLNGNLANKTCYVKNYSKSKKLLAWKATDMSL